MDIYTTTDLADMLKVSSATIRNEIERGRLTCFYVGNLARFTQHHIDEYVSIKDFNKSIREIELEQEIGRLILLLASRDKAIEDIKDIILRNSHKSVPVKEKSL